MNRNLNDKLRIDNARFVFSKRITRRKKNYNFLRSSLSDNIPKKKYYEMPIFSLFLFSFDSMTYCVQVVLGTHVLRIVRFPYEHHNIFIYNSYNRNVDTRDFETFYSNINVENRLIYEFFFLRKHTVYLHCVSMVRIER